jgi:hypothetical protein
MEMLEIRRAEHLETARALTAAPETTRLLLRWGNG